MRKSYLHGFILVELSIVLVIGGAVVGWDLIKAAEIRSQLSQVEELSAVTSTFKIKYNAIPGDMLDATSAACNVTNETIQCRLWVRGS
ncbi:MAG: hypothetical protein AB7L92_07455 [Alphaproteobacteria bacterium]